MIFFLILALVILFAILLFMQLIFHENPFGKQLKALQKSLKYKENAFQNLSEKPALTQGIGQIETLKRFF